MKLRISTIRRSIFALILVLFLNITANAKYSGGTGEPNNPYQIATAEDLIALGNEPNDNGKNFIMTADIDLAGYIFDKGIIAPTYKKFEDTSFTGVFDGNNHTISNLNIQSNVLVLSQGLFGSLDNAKVINLGLIDINYNTVGTYIGGLAGQAFDSIISNCYVTGTINGDHKGGAYVVGGLIGSKSYGIVSQSYFTGTVIGYECVGGLAGEQTGSLIHCFSNATVNGHQYIGGLVGRNGTYSNWASGYGNVTQSYSIGEVTGHSYTGGLIGYNKKGSVAQCYSTGKINGNYYSGGMVGKIDIGSITKSFWDTETSGMTTSAGGIGKTTSEMYDPNMFINAGWDFAGEIQNGTHEVWQIPQGGGYPEFSIFNGYIPLQLAGLGTQDDPYLISDSNQLGAVIYYSSNANYRLSNAIDLSGINWNTAIVPYFDGNFDGNNLTISNITIDGIDYIGLFGIVYPEGQIRNTGIIDVNITSAGEYTGGLVSTNYGTVTQCYVSGEIRNNDFIGDLAGRDEGCYIGGLAGYNEGNINNCYSNTAVDGNNYAGGLLGINRYLGSVDKCYSTGKITCMRGLAGGIVGAVGPYGQNITNSFWDEQTSGQTTSKGGVGKTTAEMQTKSTFTDVGWDFVGETDNGTEDIWWIDEGNDYPKFLWERQKSVRLPVVELDAVSFDTAIAVGVVLVDFYATWCSHCTTQAPILEDVADQLEGRAQVAKLDVDNAAGIAQRYGITAIPTLIVFKEGVETKRFIGVTSAEDLVTAVLAELGPTE